MTHICAHPDCSEEATFPAPRDPRNLQERQFFCEKHIKEFNRQWNGLTGFNNDEIFSMQSGAATWGRPTWRLGVHTESFKKATAGRNSNHDPYTFFDGGTHAHAEAQRERKPTLPKQIQEAKDMLNVKDVLNSAEIKKSYVALAKKYHPDMNQSDEETEEKIKKINAAYKVLREYAKRNNKN